MKKTLYVHLIHTLSLIQRKKYVNGSMDFIKNIAEKNDYLFKINIITEPTIEYIDKNIEKYNKNVNYDKESDDDFNNLIQKLNSPQISNIEKHKNAYDIISSISKLESNKSDLHLIIEDDIVISQEYSKNIETVFKDINKIKDWDIIFTCLSHKNSESEQLEVFNSRENFKILLDRGLELEFPKDYETMELLFYECVKNIFRFKIKRIICFK